MLPGAVSPLAPNRFRVLAEISRKQGTILQHVFDTQKGFDAALKRIDLRYAADPTIRARYPRELELVRNLSNPGIVPVFEYGEDPPGWFYILMPWMQGGSLASKLRSEGALSLAQVDCVLQPVTGALDAAHALGLLHQDLHPENILFDANGQAFLSDFGMLRFARAWEEDPAGWVFGPPAYLPPEMAVPGAQPDHRSDIYMLGALTFEMLTGSPPYLSQTPQGTILQHLVAPLPRLSDRRDAPAGEKSWNGLDSVLHCALAKEPEARFDRAGELLSALLAAEGLHAPAQSNTATIFTLSGRPPTRTISEAGRPSLVGNPAAPTEPEGVPARLGLAAIPPPPAPVRRRRRGWIWALAILVLALVGVFGAPLLNPNLSLSHLPTAINNLWPALEATFQAEVKARITAISASTQAPPAATLPAGAPTTASAALTVVTQTTPTAEMAPADSPSPTLALLTATLAPTPTLLPAATFPPPTSATTYTIAYNDSLFTIASHFYVDVNELAAVNNLHCDSKLPPATQIVIPPSYSFVRQPELAAITTGTVKSLALLHILDCTTGVKALDVSPDGRTLAVANGNFVFLWEVGSWKPLARLKGHQAAVNQVRFSPDSKTLASAAEDRTIRLWDVATGEERVKMRGHTHTITALVFSPGGQLLVSASRDQTVRFWQVDGTFLRSLRGYPAFSAAFSPDGRTLAVGFTDVIRLYRVEDFELMTTYPSVGVVHSLAFSPSGNLLASPREVWSLPLNQRIYTYNNTGDGVAFSKDGRLLQVGRRFYRVSDGDLFYELKMPVTEAPRAGDVFDQIVLSPDGGTLFWGSPDGLFVYGFLKSPGQAAALGASYIVQDGDTLFSIANAHGKTVDGLMRLNSLTCANVIFPSQELIIPPGDSLNTLITGQSPVLTLDSITGLRAAGTFDNTCLHTLGDMFFSPGGDYLVSGSGLWNIKTGAMVLQVSNPPVTPGGVYDEFLPSPLAVFAPNAAQAAVRTGQTVELWDLLTGKRTAIFSGHSDNVTSLAYSPDGTQLASSANIKDKDILFWNVADGARVRSLSGWSAYDLRFTPNGQLLLANSADTMRFWDLTSGRMVNGMTGIGRYELSPDGNLLAYVACTEQAAYGCKNEVVTLYDIPNSRTFLSLVPTTSQVSSLALSPDGKYVGAASGNGATVWNTADGSEKIRLGDVRITARMDRLYFVPASPGAEISMVATLTIDSQLWFWNIETGDIIHNLFLPNTRLAFTPNARYLLAQYGSTMSVYQVP